MGEMVRIYPEISREYAEKLKKIAKEEHRNLQEQVGYILDQYLQGNLVQKEACNA